MTWFVLFLAGLAEVGWAIGLKYAEGFTRLWPSVITLVLMTVSFLLLSQALKSIPVGTAYAVWTGIGVIGVTLGGMVLFDEPAAFARLFFIGMIACGIVGLRFLSTP